MNKVRRELPVSAKCSQQRYFSKIMKAGDIATLNVYQCKPKKNVCVLSSLHMSAKLGATEKKPETIEFYSKTKCGVDVADQMARLYSVKAGTRRWPVAVFYNILDLASINVLVLYKKQTGDKISGRDFLFKLATELREDYFAKRSNSKTTITRPHSISTLTAPKKAKAEKRKQCQIATNCPQNKTSKLFFKCNKTVCGRCTATELSECINCATKQM